MHSHENMTVEFEESVEFVASVEFVEFVAEKAKSAHIVQLDSAGEMQSLQVP